jgi:nicotinamidase-related amidase
MKVLVVVDMQNDFIDGALANEAAQKILPEVCALIKDYADNGDLVIFTQDTHYGDYLNTLEGKNLPVPHCIHGSYGRELHPAIKEVMPLQEGKYLTIIKDSFGAFDFMEQLDCFLDTFDICFTSIEDFTFVGTCTGICVINNVAIVRANCPEIPIYVRADACACVTPESHQTALKAMETFQIKIVEG